MWHAEAGYLAATNELMSLHVSLDTRRMASMAPEILDRLGTILAVHQKLPLPPQVGRSIGLSRRPGPP
jgi:acyl-CoA thioester hydrolase